MEETKEKFYRLQTRADVAELLEIEEKSLRFFLYAIRPENMYHEFTIDKKTGGKRKICAPNKKLKNIQRKLANILNEVYKVKPAAHGFVREKDIVTNAKNHTKRKWVFNLDLENFFEQINFGRVRGMLIKPPYGIGEEAATVIAQIACYKGKLPQGAPSSPILTNMICAPLDTQLTRMAAKYNMRYSRYADDITFSSYRKEILSDIAINKTGKVVVGEEIADIIHRNGFQINQSKTRIADYRARQEVTGLVVNQFVNVRRSYIKEIRAILNHCERTSLYEAAKAYIEKGKCKNNTICQLIETETDENRQKVEEWFVLVLKGRLEYIRHVKGKANFVFLKYAKELNSLCGDNIFKIDKEIILLEKIEKSVFVLESQKCVQGSGFILKGIGLLTNYHVTEDDDLYDVQTYNQEKKVCVSNSINLVGRNRDIDYACYEWGAKSEDALELGNSNSIGIGSEVIMIGYPNYSKGNSPEIQEVKITSSRMFFGQTIYTVGGRVVHGASGGVVLDKEHKVVGIIRCGANSIQDTDSSAEQGIIPINFVIDDLKKSFI